MGQIVRNVGKYTLNQVDYPQKAGGYDVVCQVKDGSVEICHCTWHPDGNYHCKDRQGNSMSPNSCPCYGHRECLKS